MYINRLTTAFPTPAASTATPIVLHLPNAGPDKVHTHHIQQRTAFTEMSVAHNCVQHAKVRAYFSLDWRSRVTDTLTLFVFSQSSQQNRTTSNHYHNSDRGAAL